MAKVEDYRDIQGHTMTVQVGDTMRISVALIQQIFDQDSAHQSEVVKLTDVVVEKDGTKTLYLCRLD